MNPTLGAGDKHREESWIALVNGFQVWAPMCGVRVREHCSQSIDYSPVLIQVQINPRGSAGRARLDIRPRSFKRKAEKPGRE